MSSVLCSFARPTVQKEQEKLPEWSNQHVQKILAEKHFYTKECHCYYVRNHYYQRTVLRFVDSLLLFQYSAGERVVILAKRCVVPLILSILL